ncbi:MAG: hypothetical protein JWP97_199 [Labilithrix sp.]|nr:hypothetical protein [Labilithrix sp.]
MAAPARLGGAYHSPARLLASSTMKLRAFPVLSLATFAGVALAMACGASDDALPGSAEGGTADGPATDVTDAGPGVVPRGGRTLGLAMIIGDLDFAGNVQIARAAGATATNVTLAWDEIERLGDAGDSDAAPPITRFNADLHVANLVLSENDMQEVLALPVIDVGGSRAPSDLVGRPLDDAELAARYDLLTDHALASSQDVAIPALFVATDVDRALGDDDAKYAAFATFVGRAAAHLHATAPKIKVGFTVSAEGLPVAAPRLAAAWAASDVVGVSVLPGLLAPASRAASPSSVAALFDAVVASAPAGKPLFFQEVGAPSSSASGSGEAQQAALVTATFEAWDRHAARIALLTIREAADPDPETLASRAARYGRSDPGFLGFLGSMGLRTADHRDKQGFAALAGHARARGF